MKKYLLLKIAAVVVVLFSALAYYEKFIPYNMDEFSSYLAIGYFHYPLNQLNSFREPYSLMYLIPFPALFPQFTLPLIVYPYVGSVLGLFYYPLFFLWPSPHSARLLAISMLLLESFFIYKLFRVDMLISLIFLISFVSYAFVHAVDINMLIQTPSIFFICFLASRWLAAVQADARHAWRYPFLIGLTVFTAIWSRLSFIFAVPALILLLSYYGVRGIPAFVERRRRKVLFGHLILMLSVSCLPTFLLLNAHSVFLPGQKYGAIIGSEGFPKALTLQYLQDRFYTFRGYFFNPLASGHRIFEVGALDKMTLLGILLAAVMVLIFVWGIGRLILRKESIGFVLVNLAAFFTAFFTILICPRSTEMYHFVMAYPFLLLALFFMVSKLRKDKIISLLLGLFVAINAVAYVKLPKMEVLTWAERDMPKIIDVMNKRFGDRYVFIIVDWGMFYAKALYGNKQQCVLYIEPLNSIVQIQRIRGVLEKTKRKALFLGCPERTNTDWDLIKREFSNIEEYSGDVGKWRIWYER